jgi:hypothetical protein
MMDPATLELTATVSIGIGKPDETTIPIMITGEDILTLICVLNPILPFVEATHAGHFIRRIIVVGEVHTFLVSVPGGEPVHTPGDLILHHHP